MRFKCFFFNLEHFLAVPSFMVAGEIIPQLEKSSGEVTLKI